MITKKDVQCMPLDDHPLLAKLCRLTMFLEEIADSIYGNKPRPLRETYTTAERIFSRLRAWSEKEGIKSVSSTEEYLPAAAVSRLILHNGGSHPRASTRLLLVHLLNSYSAYFQVVQTLFRPFLQDIRTLNDATCGRDEIWQRQACRNATDAAIDGIAFLRSTFQVLGPGKVSPHPCTVGSI